MRTPMQQWLAAGLVAILGPAQAAAPAEAPTANLLAATVADPAPVGPNTMRLGAFSISLSVKDLAASRAFYEKLGFRVWGGDSAKNWLIMKNGSTVIGLFQGMFPKNMLTFNPGWDGDANKVPDFDDVRDLQKRLKAQGVTMATEADEKSPGPASFIVIDPDGNPVLVDQHV